jgi:restriction system protein
MPRRSKTSLAEDFMSAMSRLPWWACLAVGGVAYLILHAVASRPPAVITNAAQMQGVMLDSLIRGGSYAFQYILPILCTVAAGMSFVGRRRRRELLLHVTDGGAPAAAIDAMSWQDFELLVAEGFRLKGFVVAEKGGASADGGVDMELTKDGEKWLVQAKHWRAKQVPVEVVREIAGVMPFRRAIGAYVVTSGRFTAPAREFANGRGIKLVNGSTLSGMLAQARASLDAKASGRSTPTTTRQGMATSSAIPACPACSRPMVLRKAKRGANAGGAFWGCSAYSQGCRGTRPA